MKLIAALAVLLGISACGWGQATAQPDATLAAGGQPQTTAPGLYPIGGDVKPPVPTSMPEPEFSKEARKRKMSGAVLVGLIVDTDGNPQQVHVIRSLADKVDKKDSKAALSLDASALEAVQHYQFRPAMKNGRAVPVEMNVEVHFEVFDQAQLTAQARSNPQLRTAYEHFAGTWTGIWSGNLLGQAGKKLPISLIVSETKDRDSLQIDYTYSRKGVEGYSHAVRYLLIEPETSTVRMKWKHKSEEGYQAEGLSEFLKDGYGTFTFSGRDPSDSTQELRCTMTLAKDRFDYKWEEHVSGGPYKLRATWETKRDVGISSPVVP